MPSHAKFLWLFCFVLLLEDDKVVYEKTGKTLENDGLVELLHPGDNVGATALPRAK